MASNRQGARAAVAAWFAPPAVTGLNSVFPSFPKPASLNDLAYFAGVDQTTVFSGAVGIVHIVNSKRLRKAMGGAHSGWKRIDYDIELQLLMKSTQQTAEAAMADFDALIDAVIARIEADRTFGSADVWQAGEAYLETESAEPHLTPTLTEEWSAVRFDLVQWLQT